MRSELLNPPSIETGKAPPININQEPWSLGHRVVWVISRGVEPILATLFRVPKLHE